MNVLLDSVRELKKHKKVVNIKITPDTADTKVKDR